MMSFTLDEESFKRARITYVLIIICVACYIIFNVILGDNYVRLLSQNNAQVIQDFAIWQLFTSMFMHANLLHIGSNMVTLFIFGIAAEQFFSKWEYLVIYLYLVWLEIYSHYFYCP